MIQRVQTLYLLLGALALASIGLFGFPWGSAAAGTYPWFVPTLAGLAVVTTGTALWSIFLYNDRDRQRTVVVSVQVLTVCFAAVLYGCLYMTAELSVRGPGGLRWETMIPLILPILSYGLFLLARRGIDNDIELVDSMDRLR